MCTVVSKQSAATIFLDGSLNVNIHLPYLLCGVAAQMTLICTEGLVRQSVPLHVSYLKPLSRFRSSLLFEMVT